MRGHGTIVFLPGEEDPATEAARKLLQSREIKIAEASKDFASRYPGVCGPAIVMHGRVHESVTEISRAINFDLRLT